MTVAKSTCLNPNLELDVDYSVNSAVAKQIAFARSVWTTSFIDVFHSDKYDLILAIRSTCQTKAGTAFLTLSSVYLAFP